MIERRFHRELYRGESVDEAMKRFERYCELSREETDEHWIVRVEASSPERERRIVDELSNFALGLTIQSQGE